MSNTSSFVYPGFFPFCPGNINSIVGNIAFVPNISLANVMSIAWSLENFTISRTGTASKGAATADGTGTFTLNPTSDTICTRGGGAGMWYPTVSLYTNWASWPAIKTPSGRVCYVPTDPGQLMTLLQNDAGVGTQSQIAFYVGIDPVNSGMYQLHYIFSFGTSVTSGADTASIYFNDYKTGVGSSTPITSGNIMVAGVNLAYVSAYDGTSYTGGTMSATSSNYTYV